MLGSVLFSKVSGRCAGRDHAATSNAHNGHHTKRAAPQPCNQGIRATPHDGWSRHEPARQTSKTSKPAPQDRKTAAGRAPEMAHGPPSGQAYNRSDTAMPDRAARVID